MKTFHPLIDRVLDRFTLDVTSFHGIAHWARVLENGLKLAPLTGADPLVVSLFAIFHDSCRAHEGGDIFHGPRAAKWLADMDDLGLDRHQTMDLIKACAGHTNSMHTPNVTMATCWDADRLDIGRVGMWIKPVYLTTDAAKTPEIIEWAQIRGDQNQVPEFAKPYLQGAHQ